MYDCMFLFNIDKRIFKEIRRTPFKFVFTQLKNGVYGTIGHISSLEFDFQE